MDESKIRKGKIEDYPKTVLMDVECPHCGIVDEWDVPIDEEVIDDCSECGEKFSIDIVDL